MWRLPTVGTALCVVEQPELCAAWGSCLLLGDCKGKCYVYDWESLQAGETAPRYEVQLHRDWIEMLALSKEAGGLLSCSTDGTLQLHTLTVHGELRLRHQLTSPTGKPITCFAYSVPHAAVATCGIERQVHWWSLSIAEPIVTLYGHAAAVVSLSTDDRNHQLISLDSESNVRVWDVRRFVTVQCITPLERQPVTIMLHDPAYQTLLLAHTYPSSHPSIFARVKAAVTGGTSPAPPTAIAPPPETRRNLIGAIASPTLSLALAIDDGATVRSWQCADGASCFRFQLEKPPAGPADERGGAGEEASAVGFDHSGRRLLVGRQDGKVRVYNFSSGVCLAECMPPPGRGSGIGAHACEISAVIGVRDGNLSYIVACGWSREVWIWPDQREGLSYRIECAAVLKGHMGDVTCIGHCRPGLLASGSYDGTIRMWNLASGTSRGAKLVHEPLKDGAGSVGSRGVVSAAPAANEGAKDFAKAAGTVVRVEQLAFISLIDETSSPILVSASSDARLRFWSVMGSTLLFVLPHSPPPGVYSSPSFPITALHWSAKAATLVVGDSTGRVGMWDGSDLKPFLASASAGVVVESVLVRMYAALKPRVRWHASDSPICGAGFVCADWTTFSSAMPSTATPTAASQAASPAGAPANDVLEAVLSQAGQPSRRRREERRSRFSNETPLPIKEDLAETAGALLLTAARDGSMRLWTVQGKHVGTFDQHAWRASEPSSYAEPPQCAMTEPPRRWAHPPRHGTAVPKATRPPAQRTGSSSGGGGGGRRPGKWFVDEFEGKRKRCYAGDDNHLLKLDEGALKMLNSHLDNRERWHLAWALDLAGRVKEGGEANGPKLSWLRQLSGDAEDG